MKAERSTTQLKLYLPSDSMDVRIDSCGEIEVDDVGDILEVQASGDSVLFVFTPLKPFRSNSRLIN